METIKKAVKYFGSSKALAYEIGIHVDLIYKYRTDRRFPSKRTAYKIEEKTKGTIKAFDILQEKFRIKLKQFNQENK